MGFPLLATASLFPAMAYRYYLVFVLPVAALVARRPDGPPGSGIFDGLRMLGDRRRAVGICVSLAAALSMAYMVMPGPPILAQAAGPHSWPVFVHTPVIATTAILTPLLWLIACAAIIVSYAYRPAPGAWADTLPAASTAPNPVPNNADH